MASQTIVGLELQYTQDNKHCYAASGSIASASSANASMLDFRSQSSYIVADVEFLHKVITGEQISFNISFDGFDVLSFISDGVPNYNGSHTYRILIPPHTRVIVSWSNAGSGSKNGTAFLTGRVYEHLPVRN